MAEYVVARSDELGPGERKIVTIRNIKIGLFRIGDAYYALPNICPHQFGPLCEGNVTSAFVASAASGWAPRLAYDGDVAVCPWHGLEVHIPTGQALANPKMRLRVYPVKVEGDEIKIIL